MTLDLKVVSSRTTLGIEPTLKKKEEEEAALIEKLDLLIVEPVQRT